MKQLYDALAQQVSVQVTRKYSTSFSLGIMALSPSIRPAIYGIYGFVRLADEIVDTFHDYPQATLLDRFIEDTWQAIEEGISLNPVLHSFQTVVNTYGIDHSLIQQFFESMAMDLDKQVYNRALYETYILGSAEVVGLMCLQVFVGGDKEQYNLLKPYAMKLGAAFQKVNFLRDLQQDYKSLGRTYFPSIEMSAFDNKSKQQIENEIEAEFKEALIGIKHLNVAARFGVYLAYKYYWSLFKKIKRASADHLLTKRVRIANSHKLSLAMQSYVEYKLAILS
jgi:phytoene synthase